VQMQTIELIEPTVLDSSSVGKACVDDGSLPNNRS